MTASARSEGVPHRSPGLIDGLPESSTPSGVPAEPRMRLLDLFCGAGGAAMGYHRAGFEVVGVDIRPQPNYPFEFVQADALALMTEAVNRPGYEWADFDAIHASPPCQLFSATTPEHARANHVDLITPIRPLLETTGLPYVIENVERAHSVMRNPVTICGSSLGLKVRRHRLFETNWPLMVPPCAHGQQGQPVGVYGMGSGTSQKRGRMAANLAERRAVMDIPWADRHGVTQAIPPAYTELIGHQLMQHVKARSAA
jgi:DNA (cytosine-5)-methyltransferase 1